IAKIEELIRVNPEPHNNYSGRFLAIKLLENDRQVESIVKTLENAESIMKLCVSCKEKIKKEINEDSESAITDAKYGFIRGALKECFVKAKKNTHVLTKRIDAVVTHQLWAYPIFLLLMYLMFYCTFNIGQYPMDWIDAMIGWLGGYVSDNMADGALKDLIVDGIIGGVGGVIIFLPNILILYAFISWMEDSGYMARAAFIMDKLMHKMGLHGKSFIPMIMGFGCNIPAIMATRTIEDRKSRLLTMLIVPLMSCSARLPVFIIVIGAFFPDKSALVLFCIYIIGILMRVLMAKLFSKYIIKGDSSPFVMELPPYRMPSAKSVSRHTWEKGKQYLKKMGTTILAASVIIWALSYFPRNESDNVSTIGDTEMVQNGSMSQMERSYIGQIGKFIEPVIRPCGFEWKEGVSIITGVAAKEIVASTMAVLYSDGSEEMEDEDEENARISRIFAKSGMTPLAAFSFMIFILLYMPCIPACIAIKNEANGWKWAIFTIVYTTALAWVSSTLVFQIGSLFT
ncbi:MAG: ferrous iron transport protein B, partial [Bacteroidaceae bacterium]|nr:ferrous iron transport protein B [Bacteroidaceae bacterium]